jgi:hypothetical protein
VASSSRRSAVSVRRGRERFPEYDVFSLLHYDE